MSNESISPKAFYALREFGYKNWHSVNENPFENTILLYEEMPAVIRPASDYDDYPIVIAVAVSEEQFADMSFTGVPGVWSYDKSIYLNPANTTIFFDTEEHKRIALSKSEGSAETKMVAMYQAKMFCALMNKQYNISSCKDLELCNATIYRDQRINKMKGFLYGYFIGAAMSMNEKDVAKLNILNDIKNIFAAIVASLDGLATKEQVIQLQDLFNKLKQYDQIRIDLAKFIESTEMSIEEKIDHIIALTSTTNHKSSYYNYFPQLLSEVQKGKSSENSAIKWINWAIASHIEESKSHKTLLRPENKEINLASLSLVAVNTKNIKAGKPQELFLAIVNDVLASNKYNGKTSTFKMELATEITYKAKDIFENEWNESCQAKVYLNALRKHIGGEPFLQQWNAGILCSIASVILKGDDWEKLLEFMQAKGLADYRLAFALYGTLNGFANITRDFSDIILKEDKEYVNTVYQFIHKQIHEVDVCEVPVPEFTRPSKNTALKAEVQNVMSTISTSLRKSNSPRIERALELEAAQGNFDAYLFILNNLIASRTKLYQELKKVLHLEESQGRALADVVNDVLARFNTRKDAEVRSKAIKALELENRIGDPLSLCYLLDDLKVSDKVQEKIFEHFGIKKKGHESHSSKATISKEGDLFDTAVQERQESPQQATNPFVNRRVFSEKNNEDRSIITDPDAVTYLKNYHSLGIHKSLIIELFQEFQKEYQSGYYYNNEKHYSRNNKDVIEHFCNFCLSSKNKKHIEWSSDVQRMIDSLKAYLLKLYR